jgi:3-oxoacyl-[acyl-carrier protein] reductase
MDMMLQGKRALVTGSTGHIGRMCAVELAAEGVTVAISGRDRDKIARVVDSIRETGGRAVAAPGDLMTDEGVTDTYAAVEAAMGGVDILVNNFGSSNTGPSNPAFFDLPSEEWYATYRRNVVSATEMIKLTYPAMKAAGWGRIVNISTISALRAGPTMPDYSAANAAQNAMTKSLSKAVAQSGVTVNAVSPGLILTDTSIRWLRSLAKQYGWGEDFDEIQRLAAKDVMKICTNAFGSPEDIAAAVVFLASPRANYITGVNLVVDGGACEEI